MYPSEHRYTRDHEWVRVEDDVCVVGITDFAQKELGEVVYVELPEIGHMFDAHDEMGTIESVKAVAEVYTPVAGEVIEVNDNLKDDPAAINDDPHGDGWLVKLKYSASTDFEDLMDAEEYEAFVQEGK
jgi:glycine cleavage system H protein